MAVHRNVKSQLAAALQAEGTELERAFACWWQRLAPPGAPEYVRELKIIPGRDFRADFCWPDIRVIVECEGVDHRMVDRYQRDLLKYNLCAEHGWTLLRCNTLMMREAPADFIRQVVRVVCLED